MAVQSNKTLGAIGACLTLTGVISTVITIIEQVNGFPTDRVGFWVTSVVSLLAFVGSILVLVAMYGFSKDYSERRIFTYLIYGIVAALVSGVVIGVAWFGFTLIGLLSQFSNVGSSASSSQIQALIAPYVSALIPAMSVVSIVVMFFVYRSYNLLAHKSGVPLFRTAAKTFVLSAIVNIILGTVFAVLAYTSGIQYTTIVLALAPGAFIQYVAWALSAKGFLAINTPETQATPTQPYPTAYQTNYCSNCGAKVQPSDTYCVRCGKKL